MTIDEAIKHCEEVAEKYCEKVEDGLTADDFCDSCASEHRQLAEWLKELKKWRDFGNSIGRVLGKCFTKEELFKMMEVDTDGLEENS